MGIDRTRRATFRGSMVGGASDELSVLVDVATLLDGAGVAYMLRGSMALSFSAETRLTRDIDIVLEIAKPACGTPYAPGNAVCDACVDAAQVTSFVCRDTCRADAVVTALRQSCKNSFKACTAACPPAP